HAPPRLRSCVGLITILFFSSRRRHTRSKRDWSSDVCSSDLALRKPLLHLHTQANEQLPWSSIDMDFMNLNQAAHGDREFGYILTRMGIPRVSVVGHTSEERVGKRIGTWTRAAAGWNEAQHLNMVRFGDNMRDVAVTEGDKTEAEIRFGVSVNTWGVNDLVAELGKVTDAQVDALIDEYEGLYEIEPAL